MYTGSSDHTQIRTGLRSLRLGLSVSLRERRREMEDEGERRVDICVLTDWVVSVIKREKEGEKAR